MHRWSHSRRLGVALVVSALGVFAASPAIAGSEQVRAGGELVRYGEPPAIPDGARARVTATYNTAGDSIIVLHVRGLRPDTEYGAHAHVNACGETGAAAGPHFQHVPEPGLEPGEASANPMYANPGNEIWLDLKTNKSGNGVATTTQAWQFELARRAGSVIIHAEHTHTGGLDGPAGSAGPRLACLTVGF